VWCIKESSLLKARSAKHRLKFAALSLVMVTAAITLASISIQNKNHFFQPQYFAKIEQSERVSAIWYK
jgi:hypothetical protein